MNVLFLTLLDFVSINESGIYTDLLREFVKHGHEVYVISPEEKRKQQSIRLIKECHCIILKLQIGNIQKANLFEKGIATLTLEGKFVKGIKEYFPNLRFDLVIYSTPPITLQRAVSYVKKRDGAKTYLLLKDIFPQNAVDLGILSKTGIKSLLYLYFREKEKKLYSISDYIGCMSHANVEFLIGHNNFISPEVVEVCPNSIEPVNTEDIYGFREKIRKQYNIPIDKTVFIYGGNLGKPQGVDFIIECLRNNKNNRQVYFLIVGSGTEYPKLKSYLEKENLPNVMLLGQLPKEEYEILANACDVGLIFLDHRFTIPNFPSRLLSYMQAAMPVLAATDTNTDIGKVIETGNFGFWGESGNIDEFNCNLHKLCDGVVRGQMGVNARNYLENNYTARHSYEVIMRHFK